MQRIWTNHYVIDAAQQNVLIASYAVYNIPQIQIGLIASAKRRVKIDFILETPILVERKTAYNSLRTLSREVKEVTNLYYCPRENRPSKNGNAALMHAKCAIANSRLLFLSSANFTEQAFSMNLEIGVLLKDPGLSEGLMGIFGG